MVKSSKSQNRRTEKQFFGLQSSLDSIKQSFDLDESESEEPKAEGIEEDIVHWDFPVSVSSKFEATLWKKVLSRFTFELMEKEKHLEKLHKKKFMIQKQKEEEEEGCRWTNLINSKKDQVS